MRPRSSRRGLRRLVLVGGGHAHVEVLRRWAIAPMNGVQVTVVLDGLDAVYSGMVPGFVAGDYARDEVSIDVVALARRAGAQVELSAATMVEPRRRRIVLGSGAIVGYDVASLNVGSSVRGLDLPGVREYALPTRPIGDFVARLDARLVLARLADGGRPPRVVVVGGGTAGVELGFTLHARLRGGGPSPAITVLSAGTRILEGFPDCVVRRVTREASRLGIALRGDARVTGIEDGAVCVGAERIACDDVVWATGAAPPALIAASALPRDADGFVRVEPALQVVGCDGLFAVGDCAAIEGHPWVQKAGVYAVRAGPVLDTNLRARLRGEPLGYYRPQRDFLTLINLGGRRAIGAKWGFAVGGRAVWRLKDCIDRRFVARYRVATAAVGGAVAQVRSPSR